MRFAILFCISMHVCMTSAQTPWGACDWPVTELEISEFAFTGVSKQQYDAVLDQFDRVYRPLFYKRKDCDLVIHRSWARPTVNAQYWETAGQCHVEVFGGLARHITMTPNALMQIALHEAGHGLGGYPYYSGTQLSVEGQADLYSTAIGMKRMGLGSVRSSLAVSAMLADLSGLPRPRRPLPPFPPATRTQEGHPEPPCRLAQYDMGRESGKRHSCWFKN